MNQRGHARSATLGALRWGIPMLVVAGTLFYMNTRSLISQGAPPEAMQEFWWPLVPWLLLWFVVLGAFVGVAIEVIMYRISARPRGGREVPWLN